ncbi:Cullin-4B [Echria macrotheca]|uniref:Cullin-4B n=1 Tax=Echria macrotheca TaxID=438768 RepID=A0AAJ0B4M2_9PEZI|nr:Cullin-4B [Echria macrotheca]
MPSTLDPTRSSPPQAAKRRHDSTSSFPDTTSLPASAPGPSSVPDPKRARSGSLHTSPHPQRPFHPHAAPTMSAKVQGKRPELVDLTSDSHGNTTALPRRPALQPHVGPRKLVIKNVRPATANRAADLERYYARVHAELDEALTAIFAGQEPPQPLERLYRGVEDICRKKDSAELADQLYSRCEAFLLGDAGPRRAINEPDDIMLLRRVLEHWKSWSKKLLTIRWIYSHLDRSYLLVGKAGKKGIQGINDMGIGLFRQAVFGSKKDDAPEGTPLGKRVAAAMCLLVDYDRRRDGRFEPSLLKEAVTMLRLFDVYGWYFERPLLAASRDFFDEFVGEYRSGSSSLKDFVMATQSLLAREVQRCDLYNFDSITKRQLRLDAHATLIEQYLVTLLDNGSVARLLEAHDIESMKALYDLLRLSGIQEKLKEPWEQYIRATGTAIIGDTARSDEMIIRLLELRRSLDVMIRDAFGRDKTFDLRDAFKAFINSRPSKAAGKAVTNKVTPQVGEMIAKYIDMLLRGGLKSLPKSLLSDNKDKAAAEMSGIAATGDEDAELDRQLDAAVELFRFIDGKDVFEAFYKNGLARRLLMGRSASQDAERNMLAKLRSQCGASFTHNLEQMFKDQELGKDEMASFKSWLEGTGRPKSSVDLHVNVLAAAAWPSYRDIRLQLPVDVLDQINAFDQYYKSKHSGRRLTWKHHMAHCVLRARFDRGPKELEVSAAQAVVLVLFNEVEGKGGPTDGVLSYEQIAQSTGLPGPELERTLQSLACGKVRVLSKHPKGRDVKPTDTFTVNKGFTDPKFRIKINQIQLRETKEENTETHERVAADRQYETQAAIVRIMKNRKKMTHAQLVAEVINQTKSRGAVDTADIKLWIDKLIDKDYLEREDGSYVYVS